MAQPDYVPVLPQDQPLGAERLPPAHAWKADRPGEVHLGQPYGPRLGNPGPDAGYALKLARLLEDRLVLAEGEDKDDVVSGCVEVAIKRAALLGRAPVVYDLELAFGLFGFLDEDPPSDLVELRGGLFEGAAHHYWDQRAVVDRVPDETLRLTPAQVRERLSEWKSLLRS